jgi:THO complex subunit 5
MAVQRHGGKRESRNETREVIMTEQFEISIKRWAHPSSGPTVSVPILPRAMTEEVTLALRQLANNASPNDDPASVHIRAGALFARLKALNRDANAAARAHKQITADARHDMDQTHLRLQNLLYEKRHLEREIEKCRQFACVSVVFFFTVPTGSRPASSVYQDIQMYSVEQFVELSPPEAHSEDALSDEHQLMLNRLGFELVERQRFNFGCCS